jgi:hypothetical protein
VIDAQDSLEKKLRNGDRFSVRYEFRTDFSKIPEKVELAVEKPENLRIVVNGNPVRESGERWLDSSIRKFDITGFVKKRGKNSVELEGEFKPPKKQNTRIYNEGGAEVESIYILGEFNVSGKFKEVKDGYFGRGFSLKDYSSPAPEDTVRTGYPFYAGEFEFESEFDFSPEKGKKYYISLENPSAVVTGIKINGEHAGILYASPYLLDATDYLQKGGNTISVRITSSLRNLLGPHHLKEIYPLWTGPAQFNDKKKWTGDYGFVDFGLSDITILEG